MEKRPNGFEPEKLFTSIIEGDNAIVRYKGNCVNATISLEEWSNAYSSTIEIEYDGDKIHFSDEDDNYLLRTNDFIVVMNVFVGSSKESGILCNLCIRHPTMADLMF